MAPEPVFISPPSDRGLFGGKEVTRNENLGAMAKGGIALCRRYCSSSWVGLACIGRRILILSRLGVRTLFRAYSTLDARDSRGCYLAPPSRPKEKLVLRRSFSPRKIRAITVELHIVQTATTRQASTHNEGRQVEYMPIAC